MAAEKLSGFICKFSPKIFQEQNASGAFHFTNVNYFRKLETDEKIGIKDPGEISQVHRFNPDSEKITIFSENLKHPFVIEHPRGTFSIKYSHSDNFSICCFTFLNMKNDFETLPNGDFVLKPEVVQQLSLEFPNHSAVIWGCGEFDKLTSNLNIRDAHVKQIQRSPVHYYEKSNATLESLSDNSWKSLQKSVFEKENRFSSQREFRLAAYCDIPDYDFTLEVNKISKKIDSLSIDDVSLLKNFFVLP